MEEFDEAVLRSIDEQQKRSAERILLEAALARLPEGTWLERLLKRIALWAPFGRMLVDYEDPYMLRTYLVPEGFKIHKRRPYLHYFYRGDDDRAWHNHPWESSKSLILTGGYRESRLVHDGDYTVAFGRFHPGTINTIERDTFHKVELLDPARGCWTLFVSKNRLAPSSGYDWSFKDLDGNQEVWGEHHKRRYGKWPETRSGQ